MQRWFYSILAGLAWMTANSASHAQQQDGWFGHECYVAGEMRCAVHEGDLPWQHGPLLVYSHLYWGKPIDEPANRDTTAWFWHQEWLRHRAPYGSSSFDCKPGACPIGLLLQHDEPGPWMPVREDQQETCHLFAVWGNRPYITGSYTWQAVWMRVGANIFPPYGIDPTNYWLGVFEAPVEGLSEAECTTSNRNAWEQIANNPANRQVVADFEQYSGTLVDYRHAASGWAPTAYMRTGCRGSLGMSPDWIPYDYKLMREIDPISRVRGMVGIATGMCDDELP